MGPSPQNRSSEAAETTHRVSWCPETDIPKAELCSSPLISLPFAKVTHHKAVLRGHCEMLPSPTKQ